MNNAQHIPPSIADLEVYLIQLQEVLRRRQDAAAAAEIAKIQLRSLEAQAQRAADLESARLKADADQVMLQEAIRSKIESDRIRQEGEIDKARIAADAEAYKRKVTIESELIAAEAMKSARIDAIREHSKRQSEASEASRQYERAAAIEELHSYLQMYKKQFGQFQKLSTEVSNYINEQTEDQVLLKGLRVVREGVRLFPRFTDLITVLHQLGISEDEAAALIEPSVFSSLQVHLDVCTRNVESIPAMGLDAWQPMDDAGVGMPPWADPKTVPLWRERGKTSIWAVFSEPCFFALNSSHSSASEILVKFNSTVIGGRSNWALPTIEELRRFTQFKSLSLLGANEISRAWVTYASAPGRISSYSFIDGKRETTGEMDKCSLLLVSS